MRPIEGDTRRNLIRESKKREKKREQERLRKRMRIIQEQAKRSRESQK